MLVDLTEVLPESLDAGVYLAVIHFGRRAFA